MTPLDAILHLEARPTASARRLAWAAHRTATPRLRARLEAALASAVAAGPPPSETIATLARAALEAMPVVGSDVAVPASAPVGGGPYRGPRTFAETRELGEVQRALEGLALLPASHSPATVASVARRALDAALRESGEAARACAALLGAAVAEERRRGEEEGQRVLADIEKRAPRLTAGKRERAYAARVREEE